MKLLRRILTTIVVTLVVIFACMYWIAPIGLSFYEARIALPVARIVPTELKDHSVSQAPGTKLSYLGYEFEIPWSDLDEAKTVLYPKDKPQKTRVVLTFRSGLRLIVTAVPPRQFAQLYATDFKTPPQGVEILFGPGSSTSDYIFERNVYGFTPDKMHYWSLSPALHAREQMVLLTKSIMPVKAAESGIFYISNQFCRGFQQGDPQVSRDVVVDMYSDQDHFEAILTPEKYNKPIRVTQPEVNRIVESLRKTTPGEVAASASTGIQSTPRLR